jgi:hypothetical protein
MFRKFTSLTTDPPLVRRNRAINKWLACEKDNEATNVRLLNVDPEYQIIPGITYQKLISTAERIVEQTLTPSVQVSWSDHLRFSGGASTSRGRAEGSLPSDKFDGKLHSTSRALPTFWDLDIPAQVWNPEVETIDGNVLFTVPKSATIDRCACKEPDVNMFLQHAAGAALTKLLLRVGIDLSDQSRNRNLAREGSIKGSHATIDLSSASDTLCTELVFQLLPAPWFSYLESLRCARTYIPFEGYEFWHQNEMFSSMGNAFTFPLETLVFYALAKATCYLTGTSGRILVYGDDIVVPSGCAREVCDVLSFVGFTPNGDKTFITGNFRESCGGHYVGGKDVTPFYVDRPVDNLKDLIVFLNNLRYWLLQDGREFAYPDLLDLWYRLALYVPRSLYGGHFGEGLCLVSPPRLDHRPSLMVFKPKKRVQSELGRLRWALCGNTRVPTFGSIFEAGIYQFRRRKAWIWGRDLSHFFKNELDSC